MAGGGMVKALNANQMTTTPEVPTPTTPPSPGGGGKGAGRVSPVVESRPMFQKQDGIMLPVPSMVNAAAPPPVMGQQSSEQPQQSITGMNMNTGSTNSMPAPQSAIFKKGGLIGLMRKR